MSFLSAIPFLSASAAVKALGKINPKFKNVFASAAAYGYDTHKALKGISDYFTASSKREYEDRLDREGEKGNLRSDEMVSRNSIKQKNMPGKIARGALSALAGGALGFGEREENEQEQATSANPTNPISPSPSPISKSEMVKDVLPEPTAKKEPSPVSPKGNVEKDFPQLIEAAKRMLETQDEITTYERLEKSRFYGGLLRKWEDQNNKSFEEKLFELAGKKNPAMQRANQIEKQVQGSNKRSEIEQGFSQLAQILQGRGR